MALARDHLYPDPSRLVTFLGLHDVSRFMNEPGASVARLQAAFTFLLTARGTPLVYYGDEIAMPGGGDPDNRRDFPGGWKEDARSAFFAAGRTKEEEAVHAHVRALLHLRRETAALRRGPSVNLLVADRTWAYARVLDGQAAVVVLNTDGAAATIEAPAAPAGLEDGLPLRDRLGSGATAAVEGGRLRVTLPAMSSAVFVAPVR
jgi:glycosidase